MGLEIELKAHVLDEEVQSVRDNLMNLDGCEFLGHEHKDDIYWALDEDSPVRFRTRMEQRDDKTEIVITSKPDKKFSVTEDNIENEFTVSADQWDKVMEFVKGLELVCIRRKSKEGWHYCLEVDGWNIHVELLKTKWLDGWFLESEICVGEIDAQGKESAQKALHTLLEIVGLSEDRIERRGYHKMLLEAGHPKG